MILYHFRFFSDYTEYSSFQSITWIFFLFFKVKKLHVLNKISSVCFLGKSYTIFKHLVTICHFLLEFLTICRGNCKWLGNNIILGYWFSVGFCICHVRYPILKLLWSLVILWGFDERMLKIWNFQILKVEESKAHEWNSGEACAVQHLRADAVLREDAGEKAKRKTQLSAPPSHLPMVLHCRQLKV